jgi:hypothetical protein
VGRSLLNVPHAVLLDQVVELHVHLGAAAHLFPPALAVPGLLADLAAAIPRARAAGTEVTLARAATLEIVERRAAWHAAVADWCERVRAVLDTLRSPDREALVAEVRRCLPRYLGRRFGQARDAVARTVAKLKLHDPILGASGLRPDLVPAGEALLTDASVLTADEQERDARSSAAVAARDVCSRELQDLIRRVRSSWELAALDHPLGPLPLERLAAHVAATHRAQSEPHTGTSESATGASEAIVGTSEAASSTSEPTTSTSEPGAHTGEPATSTSEPTTGTTPPHLVTVVDSLVLVTTSPVPVAGSLVTATRSRVTVSDSLATATASPVPNTDSFAPPRDLLLLNQGPGPEDPECP